MTTRNIFIASFLAVLLMGATACQKKVTNTNTTKPADQAVQYRAAAPKAFGELTQLTTGNANGPGVDLKGDVAAGSAALKMQPVLPLPIRFIFTGSPVPLTESTTNVYERTLGAALPMPTDMKTIAGLSLMNMGNVSEPMIENISFRNGDEQWTVSPLDGTITMYQSSTTVSMLKGTVSPDSSATLPSPAREISNVNTTSNTNTNKLKVDTAKAQAIAQAFFDQHGISVTNYYGPIISAQTGYAIPAVAAAEPTITQPVGSYSGQVQAIYPYKINGTMVVQSNGEPMGLTLTIDIATSKVMSFYGLSALDFTQSSYEAQTDFATVQKLAETGGYSGYYSDPNSTEVPTTINLGTPERVLLMSYLYKDNRSRELFVPALRFPITQATDGYSAWVVVPLVKDLPSSFPSAPALSAGVSGSGSAGSSAISE